MGIEVARCTTELGRVLACPEGLQLLFEAIGEHLYLLAKPRGRGWLPVCLGEHGHVFPVVGILTEQADERFDLGDIDFFERLLDGERHAGVVDILRSEPKMDKLFIGIQSLKAVELFLDEIFHGLHIMIGGPLDLLDARGRSLVKVPIDVAELIEAGMIEGCQLGQWKLAKRYEIFDLHPNAVSDERIFRKISSQGGSLFSITTVDG